MAMSAMALRDEKRVLLERLVAQRTAIAELAALLEEIEKKFEVIEEVLYRIHKSRMFYASYRPGRTPEPFAMVSAYIHTRKPDQYKENDFDSALDFLCNEAFETLYNATRGLDEKRANRYFTAHPEEPRPGRGASFKVEGWEKTKIDKDEVPPSHKLDQWRYYAIFYRGNREYWGWLELTPTGWKLHREDNIGAGPTREE